MRVTTMDGRVYQYVLDHYTEIGKRMHEFVSDVNVRGCIIDKEITYVNCLLQDSEQMEKYEKAMISEGRTMQEEIDELIGLAIASESHECFLLLVEYKRSHNLYQDNPFEL